MALLLQRMARRLPRSHHGSCNHKNGTENAKELSMLGFTGRIVAHRPKGLNSGAGIGSVNSRHCTAADYLRFPASPPSTVVAASCLSSLFGGYFSSSWLLPRLFWRTARIWRGSSLGDHKQFSPTGCCLPL